MARAGYGLLLRFDEAELGVADRTASLVFVSTEVVSTDGGRLGLVFEDGVDAADDSAIRLGSKLGSTDTLKNQYRSHSPTE